MAKQVTYTDIKNIEAKTEALEAVNVYMSKRRDARSTMKQADEGYKKIKDWTDEKGDYHVTYGLFEETTGDWSNLKTETDAGIGKPASPTKEDSPITVDNLINLVLFYSINFLVYTNSPE